MVTLARRRLLEAGVAIATGSTLAGCLGGTDNPDDDGADDDGTDDNGADDATDQLGIEHVRLVDSEPTGYREYDEVSNGTYEADELVWIYYEPVGLSTEDAGEGAVRIETTLELTVTGPDGGSWQFDEEIDREIPDGNQDEQYFFWNFQPRSPAKSGEYTAELSVTDELAGEQASAEVTFSIENGLVEPETEFRIEHVRLIEEAPTGYRQYSEKEGPYSPGEAVWIYYEPVGLPRERVDDDTIRIDVALDLTVTDPDGNVHELADKFEEELPDDGLFQFWNFQPPQPTPTGEYTAELGVTDEFTDERATAETTFTIERVDYASILEETLVGSTEIDIEIESVTEWDRTVELVYESSYDIESEEAGGEIGYISGVYASLVDEGWAVDELVGRVTDSTGSQYRFTVSSDLTRQYMEGEIDGEELFTAVMDTLEPVES